jgi:hypothetical protein
LIALFQIDGRLQGDSFVSISSGLSNSHSTQFEFLNRHIVKSGLVEEAEDVAVGKNTVPVK